MTAESPLRHWVDRDGALLRLRLARPKANLIDAAMIAALQAALVSHRGHGRLRGVLLNAEGPHFSFGASVEEHLPAACGPMLAGLHALVDDPSIDMIMAARGGYGMSRLLPRIDWNRIAESAWFCVPAATPRPTARSFRKVVSSASPSSRGWRLP